MLKTKVTEMIGCKYPIIVGTMANISSPEFVAAASNAGACAVLASANYKTPEELREAIKKTQSLTDWMKALKLLKQVVTRLQNIWSPNLKMEGQYGYTNVQV